MGAIRDRTGLILSHPHLLRSMLGDLAPPPSYVAPVGISPNIIHPFTTVRLSRLHAETQGHVFYSVSTADWSRMVDPRNCPWPFQRATGPVMGTRRDVKAWWPSAPPYPQSEASHESPLLPEVTGGSWGICSWRHISLAAQTHNQVTSVLSVLAGNSWKGRKQWEGTAAGWFHLFEVVHKQPGGRVQNKHNLISFFIRACQVASVMSNSVTPMDCSLLGSSVHGIFQARILEWVAMPSPRGSSQPRDGNRISCLRRQIPYYQHHLKSPLREGKTVILPDSALGPVSKNLRNTLGIQTAFQGATDLRSSRDPSNTHI